MNMQLGTWSKLA